MKLSKLTIFLEQIVKKLGDENLTVSFALCEGKYYVSISTHTSDKYSFTHDGYQRSCEITEKDFERNVNDVVADLVNIYRNVLIPKEEKENVAERSKKDT